MRIALATVGTTGDVVPFVALGRGLTAAGHDVTAVSWELHREAFEGAASAFFAAGPPVSRQEIADTASRAAAAGSPLAQVAVLRDFHLRHAADHFQQLRDILPGPRPRGAARHPYARRGRRPRCRAGVGQRRVRSGPAADRHGAAGRHAVARPVEPAGVVGARSDAAPPGQATARRIGGCRQRVGTRGHHVPRPIVATAPGRLLTAYRAAAGRSGAEHPLHRCLGRPGAARSPAGGR